MAAGKTGPFAVVDISTIRDAKKLFDGIILLLVIARGQAHRECKDKKTLSALHYIDSIAVACKDG
jgi:hypothetical protein